jgi:hypothetical protein
MRCFNEIAFGLPDSEGSKARGPQARLTHNPVNGQAKMFGYLPGLQRRTCSAVPTGAN